MKLSEYGKGNIFIVLFMAFMIVVCAFISYGAANDFAVQNADPSPKNGEYVQMQQPCRWIWCNAANKEIAENNKTNAQANNYNAQARNLDARSTAEVARVELDKQKQAQQFQNTPAGFFQALVSNIIGSLCLFGIVIVLGVLAYAFVTGGKG